MALARSRRSKRRMSAARVTGDSDGLDGLGLSRFIDLFAGIGGFRLALESFGARSVFSSEIDPHAARMYEANFGDSPAGDIRAIDARDIPEHDALLAGFPCQSFSISGNRRALDDSNGALFYEIVRIAKAHRPKFMLLENAANIVVIDSGAALRQIRYELDRIGYRVEVSVLNAADFGIGQNRRRAYFVCMLKSSPLKYRAPTPTYEPIYLRDVLAGVDQPRETVPEPIERADISIDPSRDRESLRPVRLGALGRGGQGERIYSVNGVATTQTAYGGGIGAKTGLYHIDGCARRLSVSECKALMGFPAGHEVGAGSRAYNRLGNAIIPEMARLVFAGVARASA